MAWRKTIPALSEAVFPGISSPSKSYGDDLRPPSIVNLPLQVSLYFNVWFYPVWLATTFIMTSVKIDCLPYLYRFIAVTALVSVACIEVLRLYLGYFGNLSEKIPEVAAFWMLSVLLQFPLQIFLTANKQFRLQPIEYTTQGIMLVMLVSQLLLGFYALRYAARIQAARFHMIQLQASTRSSLQCSCDYNVLYFFGMVAAMQHCKFVISFYDLITKRCTYSTSEAGAKVSFTYSHENKNYSAKEWFEQATA